MTRQVQKAVFPVAGLGTRFLPATKIVPKEMLPIVDKPLIQYAVEEAVRAGITDIILVTRDDKPSITQHFQPAEALEKELSAKNKSAMLASLQDMPGKNITWTSVYQHQPLGLGHAVLCAQDVVGNEPFAVILPDDLIDDGDRGCLQQMVEVYERYQCAVIAVETVPREDTDKYGIVNAEPLEPGISRMSAIVEKPKPAQAPSTLAVVGRYILPAAIFELLKQVTKGAGGEIQLTDAIAMLLQQQQVLAHAFSGKRYDCGTKFGYLQANVEYGLKHQEIQKEFSAYLSRLSFK